MSNGKDYQFNSRSRNKLPEKLVERIIERIPPNSLHAEQALLGSIMFYPQGFRDVLGRVEVEDFYYPINKLIFQACLDLYKAGKPVDVLTVSEELDKEGHLETVGGNLALVAMGDRVGFPNNLGEYADLVAEKAALRRLIDSFARLSAECYAEMADVDSIVNEAAKIIYEARGDAAGAKQFASLGEIVSERIAQMEQMKYGEEDHVISSGYPSLDKMIGGLHKGGLIVVAARPGMGKSAFALNVAHNVAYKTNTPTAVFTLEMSQAELANRFMSYHFGIELRKIYDAKLSASEADQITEDFRQLFNIPIYVDDTSGTDPYEIMSKCKKLKLEKGLGLVVIDYMQLMSGGDSRSENRQQEISAISRNLKILARDLNVPVIALSQLSRNCESRTDKRPLLSDLRESGAIEQDADVVLFLYRDQYYIDQGIKTPKSEEGEGHRLIPHENHTEVIIAKNRHGKTGTLGLFWKPELTSFYDPEGISGREAPPENAPGGGGRGPGYES